MRTQPGGLGSIKSPRCRLLRQVGGLRQLHLDRMKAVLRASIVPRRPSTLKAPIHNGSVPVRLLAQVDHPLRDAFVTGRAKVGANVEIRQHAIEQKRDAGSDGVAIVEDRNAMPVVRMLHLCRKRRVIWLVKCCPARGHL